jgi:hypothetical protein
MLRACARQHTSAYVSIRQHTAAYVSIRQHTSAYVDAQSLCCCCSSSSSSRAPAAAGGGAGSGGGHALGGGGGEGEGGVERLERLRALMREAGGTRAVEYATRVEGFECLTGVILAKVQRLKETLQMDLSAQRGWVDGGSSGSVDRYRRQGLLRVRADALTIRQVCGRMRTYASGLTPS